MYLLVFPRVYTQFVRASWSFGDFEIFMASLLMPSMSNLKKTKKTTAHLQKSAEKAIKEGKTELAEKAAAEKLALAAKNCFIATGAYEGFLYGFHQENLELVWSYPAHLSSIRCLALNHKYLVSGGSDEHVKIYSLNSRKEVGSLMHHQSTITCLAFFQNQHLITACEEGLIALVRQSDWELLKVLKGHVGQVNSIAVHPSGKILASVGRDGTCRTWDLQRGILAHTMKLSEEAYSVFLEETRLVLVAKNCVKIVDLGTNKRIVFDQVSQCATFDQQHLYLVGGTDIFTYNLEGELISKIESGHIGRVKDISFSGSTLATCSSDGIVRLFKDMTFVQEYNTKSRLICLAISPE